MRKYKTGKLTPKITVALRRHLEAAGIYEPIFTFGYVKKLRVNGDRLWLLEKNISSDPEIGDESRTKLLNNINIEKAKLEEERKWWDKHVLALRYLKMEGLRNSFGLAEDDWKGLAIRLAYLMYPGFTTVDEAPPPTKAKAWTSRDLALLVVRVSEALENTKLLNVAIGRVKGDFPDDYASLTDRALENRYKKSAKEAEQYQHPTDILTMLVDSWRKKQEHRNEAAKKEPVPGIDLASLPMINTTRH